MAFLDKLKKFNREHQPKELRPKTKPVAAKAAAPASKPAVKAAKKSAPVKAKAKAQSPAPKNVPIPAKKPRSGKTAQVASKVPAQTKVGMARPEAIPKNNKELRPRSVTNLKMVPKGRKYSGGILSGLFKSK